MLHAELWKVTSGRMNVSEDRLARLCDRQTLTLQRIERLEVENASNEPEFGPLNQDYPSDSISSVTVRVTCTIYRDANYELIALRS